MAILSSQPRKKEWFDSARDAGYYDFVVKPLLPSELDEKISFAWEHWQNAKTLS